MLPYTPWLRCKQRELRSYSQSGQGCMPRLDSLAVILLRFVRRWIFANERAKSRDAFPPRPEGRGFQAEFR